MPVNWSGAREILRVGLLAAISSVQTYIVIGITTALAGLYGGTTALAGYGTAARLEFVLIPLVFGIGSPLIAMVGTNIGAGERHRALRIAWCGAGLAFGLTEAIGVAAAIWPMTWLSLFGRDAEMLAVGSAYLRLAGPAYGFFGLGLSLYFASQGAGRLRWPLLGSALRLLVAVGGGWVTLRVSGSLTGLFAAIGLGLLVYGLIVAIAIGRGVWFDDAPDSRLAKRRSRWPFALARVAPGP